MKQKIYKILKITGIVLLFLLLVAYFTGSTLLVQQQQSLLACKHVKVEVLDSMHTHLIFADDIHQVLQKHQVQLAGNKLQDIDIYRLEALVAAENGIKDCQIYKQLDGKIFIQLTQRNPLLRLDSPQGGYYLDHEGGLFPIIPYRSAYVPVVSGNVPIDQAKWTAELYEFGCYLERSVFWNAQIEQIYVHSPQNIELVQRVGTQTIFMGDLSQFAYKLKKLYTFYHTVIPVEGWDKYESIDIRFGDQLVCKKTNQKPVNS